MAATVTAPPPLSPLGDGAADNEDSNISSPLSEVDDKEDDDDDIEHMQLDHDEDRSSAIGQPDKDASPGASDSDSALSEAHSDAHSDANDTEAETERLYDTPRNQRQRDVRVDQYNEGQVFEHTPSKLRRAATAGGDIDHGLVTGDEASIPSSPTPIDESPSKPATTQEVNIEDIRASQERKRKRSPLLDQSESEQPLRKRTSSLEKTETNLPSKDGDAIMGDTDATPQLRHSLSHSGNEDEAQGSPRKQRTDVVNESIERETRVIKKNTRGSRRKTAEVEIEAVEDVQSRTNAEETDEADQHENGDVDADEEAITAHDEECK